MSSEIRDDMKIDWDHPIEMDCLTSAPMEQISGIA